MPFLFTKTLHHILNQLKKSYTLDVRALSLMRIGVGIILLVDLYIRSLSITAFFTDEGVLPIEALKNYNWSPTYFCFHALSGDLWWQVVLFIINALCIILLIIGFRTRLFTFICWVLLTSLQNRNPYILQGGDDLLRLLLFWGIFLPWGERYSILKKSYQANQYLSWANLGYILLPCSVFFFSAMLKTSSEWHEEGTAIYYALSLDQIRMPIGTLIYPYPTLLQGFTYVTYYIELLAPIIILFPFLSPKVRLMGIIAIITLFIGIACTLYVGLFYIIGITSVIGLMPSSVMDWFEKRFYKSKTILLTTEFEASNNSFILNTGYLLKTYFIIFIFSFCFMMNLTGVKSFPYILDSTIINFGKLLRLEQNWGMFSPYILKDDGWFVYSGFSIKHEFIDIKHSSKPVSYSKPTPVVTEFESDRWRKFQENYTFNNNNYMRPYYCKYLINKWNKEHPKDHVIDLSIFFMKETSLPNYQTKPIAKLALCNCQDK